MAALFHCMTTAAATAYPSNSEARIRRPSNASLSTSLGVHHDDTTRPQTAVPLKGRPPTSLVFARRARGANLESQGGGVARSPLGVAIRDALERCGVNGREGDSRPSGEENGEAGSPESPDE